MAEIDKKDLDNRAGKMLALMGNMAMVLDKLYTCLRDQQKALMGWQLADFMETVKAQRRLARENLRIEETRLALVAELFGPQRARKVALREIAEMAGGDWPDKFRAASVRLKQAGDRVQEMKKQNEALITRSRDLIDGQLRLMVEMASLNRNTYGQSGRKTARGSVHKMLDQKA